MVTDNLDDFEFQDAYVKAAEYRQPKLILHVDGLNIRKEATQNSYSCDMQIDDACITFQDIMLDKYVEHSFATGKIAVSKNDLEYSGEEAKRLFQQAFKKGFLINTLSPTIQGVCLIGMLPDSPEDNNDASFFSMYIRFVSVSVKWQNCCAQAWHVRQNQKNYPLCIASPGRELTVEALLSAREEKENSPSRTVSATVDGVLYIGTAESTELALIDIAKQLPGRCSIKSCLSCRHGNFCPFGNADNEIFCIKDFSPKQKSDLYEVTQNGLERIKRRHLLFDLCPDYMPAIEEYYHYNDYLYLVNRQGV